MKKRVLIASTCIFLLSACNGNVIPNIKTNDCTVSLITDSHCQAVSDSIIKVERGNNAVFTLSFDDGYAFGESSYGSFEAGSNNLTVQNVQFSLNVYVTAYQDGDYKITILNDESKGDVVLNPVKAGYDLGDVVHVSVTPKNDNRFLCYSYSKYYRGDYGDDGGNILSFDQDFAITISGNEQIAVNYFSDKSEYFIDYDLNGGETLGHNTVIPTDCFVSSKPDYGNFSTFNIASYAHREGFVFYGLNTKKDGTGIAIGSGSRVSLDMFDEHGKLTLFAMWKKETSEKDFDFKILEDNTVAITSFIGDKNIEELVIPELIAGLPVSTLCEGAFLNLDQLESIFLSTNVKCVEPNAFSGLSLLKKLYIFSDMTQISDESFNSETLESVFINKNSTAKTWDSAWRNLSGKCDKVASFDHNTPTVYFVGHSIIYQNHDLTPFIDKYGDKYRFYIFGGYAGISSAFPTLRAEEIVSLL